MRRPKIFERIGALDNVLVKRGFPPMSPWWKATLRRFYESDARTLVCRVGRRGGKSSTFCRIAVAEAIYGEHIIPPGDIGVVAMISVDRRESAGRLRTIRAILDALEIRYRDTTEELELDIRPIVFKTFSATIGGVSGFTGICILADEVAKWKDRDTGINPATEVISSVKPTMITQPAARMFLCSSPWSTLDAHYQAFERGEIGGQQIALATSWEANPTLSEEDTHSLEPDDRVWKREYAAIPQQAVTNAFEYDAIGRAMREPPVSVYGRPVLVIDPSSGGLSTGDNFTYAIVQWGWPKVELEQWVTFEEYGVSYFALDDDEERIPNPAYKAALERSQPFLHVRHIGAFMGRFSGAIRADEIVEQLAKLCVEEGIDDVHSDQRESMALESLFRGHGLQFTAHTWSQPNKVDAVATIRRWMAEGALIIELHEGMRRELAQFAEKLTPSGLMSYGARGKAHDDYVALLLTAAMAETEGMLQASPLVDNEEPKRVESLDDRTAIVMA